MNRFKCLFVRLMTLVIALGLLAGGVGALAEAPNPGLDVVIVIDFTFSTFPGVDSPRGVDQQLMCLDAAAMLINMCDANYSKAAIVPFTDGNDAIESYNRANGNMWGRWIDVSDPAQRIALCDSLFTHEMYTAGKKKIHNGYSNYAVGMEQALELVRTSESGNQQLVLVLGDGENTNTQRNDPLALEYAEQIKSFGAQIYCLQFGNKPEGQYLLPRMASSPETYWPKLTPADLKDRFSKVFAELIGTEQETIHAQPITDTNDISFEIKIPHKAITEVNVVLDINKISGDVQVLDGNREPVRSSADLFQYTNRNYDRADRAYQAYDFVSLKIINPDAGVWHMITTGASKGTPEDEMTIDLLYNYQIELEAGLAGAQANAFKKNGSLTIQARFLDANGRPSDDYSLYEGLHDDGTGIQATLTIYDANGRAVYETPMEADREAGCFTHHIDLSSAGFVDNRTAEDQHFRYVVSASGDYLLRTADSTDQTFYVYGEKPIRLTEEPVEMGTLTFDDVFGNGTKDYLLSGPLSNYFSDGDGDELTYVIDNDNVYGLQPEIGESGGEKVLGVRRLGDENLQGGYVDVYAQDSAGNRSESVRFMANVVSIGKLVEDCVSFRTEAELENGEGRIAKGQSVKVNVAYDLAPLSAEYPYSELSSLVTREQVDAALKVNHTLVEMPEDTAFTPDEAGLGYTLTAGHRTGRIQVDSDADINGIARAIDSAVFEVYNQAPVTVENVHEVIKNAGAVEDPLLMFVVDKDKPDTAKLSFDLGELMIDPDGAFDHLSFTASSMNRQEKGDLFTPARGLLRLFGLIPKSGDVLGLNTVGEDDALADSTLAVEALRSGRAEVTVKATDEDGEYAIMVLKYSVTSSRERLMCIITYVVLAILLIALITLLVNKFVIHQAWPRHNDEYRVTQNDFTVLSDAGQESRRFGRTGRKPCKLKALADRFAIMDDGSGAEVFSKVMLWPTTGNQLVVELKKKARLNNATVKVDGVDISRGRKAKWGRNGKITVTYRDMVGNENTCVFKRD